MNTKRFDLKSRGTSLSKEIVAGLTTFFAMVYIIVVNPLILGDAGMDAGGVFVATILAAVIGTLVMGIVADVPYAQAPGMGLNAFFAYTVCSVSMGFKWQEALAIVFICGLINVLITVTKVRKSIIKSIPESLQNAIGGAIGLFIAYLGMVNSGIINFDQIPFGGVQEIAAFDNPSALLAVIGLAITVVLLLLKVKGAIFIGIIASTIIAIPMGIVDVSNIQWFDISAIGNISETSFAFFGETGFASMFASGDKIMLAIVAIFAFSLSDTFDTIGTFIGTGRVSGIFDEEDEKALQGGKGFKSKMDKALFADATATSIGALLGTSNTTTYVESASGIAAGGRTGLTSMVTAFMFLLCLPFANVFKLVPSAAVAPALIVVGIMMASSLAEIKWGDFAEAVPAFLTLAFTAFTYSISNGIAAGFIFYVIVKLTTGKAKEVHPILYGSAALFLAYFVFMAIQAAGVPVPPEAVEAVEAVASL